MEGSSLNLTDPIIVSTFGKDSGYLACIVNKDWGFDFELACYYEHNSSWA